MTKKISILGSTGSVGVSTLDVISRHPDRFEVVALSAGSNLDLLSKQIGEFHPRLVSVKTEDDAHRLKGFLADRSVEILYGKEGTVAVATVVQATMVVSAIVGAAGLLPTLSALQKGKTVGLANKESMVIAGELMRQTSSQTGAVLLPIDSEHSALFQCLQGNRREDLKRLILTASGGPFLHRPQSEFASITVEEALKHPNWSMGNKITIDSATMMNKGLEVMEARWLFDVMPDRISVLIHPQSIVHSLVEYRDGSVMAQLGLPDMRVPIAYALSYPERIESGAGSLDFFKWGRLDFLEPDFEKFPCLRLSCEVAQKGLTYPAVLNAANEIAVAAFLEKKISFVDIEKIIRKTVEAHQPRKVANLEDVLEADRWGRELATQKL